MPNITDAPRPRPNDPPRSYRVADGWAVFYRHVSAAELADWRRHGCLRPQEGGYFDGKCLTTSPELAGAWGSLFVEAGAEPEPGSILRIEVPAAVASEIYFMGSRTDGVGAAYFATYNQLAQARVSEVSV